jgi:hypothetical protein
MSQQIFGATYADAYDLRYVEKKLCRRAHAVARAV